MSKLDNPKHELFAQYLAEGLFADEAYAKAGYRPNRGNASTLKANQNVLTRVREIQERRAKMADVTVDAITEEFTDAIEKAGKDGAHAAVMAGIMGKAKLHGLIIDKSKVEQGRLDGMDDDAIADDIESRLARIAERRAEGVGEAGGGAGAAAESEPDSELQAVSEAAGVPRQGQDG